LTCLATRIQITTDGYKVYAQAVEGAFGVDVDYAMLMKLYGNDSFDANYSPGECMGTQTAVMQGNPDPKHISTSFVETQNLTMRMAMRRFTRLTTPTAKSWKTMRPLSRCTTCTATTAAFTARCGSHRRWKRDWLGTFGLSKNL